MHKAYLRLILSKCRWLKFVIIFKPCLISHNSTLRVHFRDLCRKLKWRILQTIRGKGVQIGIVPKSHYFNSWCRKICPHCVANSPIRWPTAERSLFGKTLLSRLIRSAYTTISCLMWNIYLYFIILKLFTNQNRR